MELFPVNPQSVNLPIRQRIAPSVSAYGRATSPNVASLLEEETASPGLRFLPPLRSACGGTARSVGFAQRGGDGTDLLFLPPLSGARFGGSIGGAGEGGPTVNVNRQPSTVNRQPSTVNRQPSTVNRQPSTVNRQPSTVTVNRQPSTVNRQPSTVNRQPSTVNRQPSTVNRQPSTVNGER